MSDTGRVLRFLPATVAEGPGRRAALWAQGCSIRCPGCFNPHSWPAAGGELIPWPELAARVEIRISPSGEVAINGFAPVAILEDLLTGSLPTLRRRRG
jgi:pyruvate-formate lyase-activating enzyme